MKRALSAILALVMVLSLCACGSGEEAETTAATEAQETAAATEATQSAETVDPNETPEEKVARLFDVAKYEEENSFIDDNRWETITDEITIYDKTFKLGMSYNDVLAAGLGPWKGDDDQGEEIFELSQMYTSFADSNGYYYHMMFHGEKGATLSASGVLAGVIISPEDMVYFPAIYDVEAVCDFSVAQVNASMKLDELVAALGQPWYIGGYWDDDEDEPELDLVYTNADETIYLSIYIDLLTNEITKLKLSNDWG